MSRIWSTLDRAERASRRTFQRFVDRYWWIIVLVVVAAIWPVVWR